MAARLQAGPRLRGQHRGPRRGPVAGRQVLRSRLRGGGALRPRPARAARRAARPLERRGPGVGARAPVGRSRTRRGGRRPGRPGRSWPPRGIAGSVHRVARGLGVAGLSRGPPARGVWPCRGHRDHVAGCRPDRARGRRGRGFRIVSQPPGRRRRGCHRPHQACLRAPGWRGAPVAPRPGRPGLPRPRPPRRHGMPGEGRRDGRGGGEPHDAPGLGRAAARKPRYLHPTRPSGPRGTAGGRWTWVSRSTPAEASTSFR